MIEKRELAYVILEYTNGEQLRISRSDIERMRAANEALELLEQARQVAKRLSSLSEAI